MKRLVQITLISVAAAALSGCSVWNSWFGDDKTRPATLETLRRLAHVVEGRAAEGRA